MIRYFIIFLYKFFYIYKFNLKFFYKKHSNIGYSYDFQNTIFINESYQRNTLYTENYLFNKKNNEIPNDFHTFDWLTVAKKIGGAQCITLAKKQIFDWHKKKYSKLSHLWISSLVARRLTNLIYNYDFFAVSSTEDEKKIIHKIILEHFLILNCEFKTLKIHDQDIVVPKIVLLMNLIYKKKTTNTIQILLKQIKNTIDQNGRHKSNNPSYQAEFVCQMHEIKNIFLFFNLKIPEEIENQIKSMTSTMLSFLHKDNTIALFNGSNNANLKDFIKTLNLVKDLKPKKLKNATDGIVVYEDKKKKLLLDITRPSSKKINQNLHAGTLSFEISGNKEKIITNCGSIETRHGKKPEYLRYSAAHSTIILNNTNISELVENKSYRRAPKKINFIFDENNNEIVWEASHDGYEKNFNKIIKRKILIFKDENKIIGKDSIISTKIKSNKILYNIRFHLMPHCSCLLTNNHKSVLIKTGLNESWIFESISPITVEDSIFVGDGKKLEQTKQIVISNYAEVTNKIENWSFKKI